MVLSPMRYKNYVWPHNPRVYAIEFKRPVAAHKVPAGRYILQNLGLSYRVLKGDGEFYGEGAYAEFKKLATVFYDDSPGLLIHPVWQDSNAYFVSLLVNNVPTENYVSYSFEFWEKYDGYEDRLGAVNASAGGLGGGSGSAGAGASGTGDGEERRDYTVVYGDCLWNIAGANGLTLDTLISLNPQIKNPNLIYPGDVLRLG